jgi:glycosyltransferase involved in cell wall biosynthesis
VRRVKILVTSTLNTPFIHSDITLLRRHHEVRHLVTRGLAAIPSILSGAAYADVTITWFASVYAFAVVRAARLAGKRPVIIVGGVDAARMPAIGYGIWLSPWKSALVSRALRAAWRVLVVDESLRHRITELAAYDGQNIRYLPTGYDAAYWVPRGEKEPTVVTVAAVEDRPRFLAKGVDRFLACAGLMAETKFLLVGMGENLRKDYLSEIPANVEVLPPLPREALRDLFARTKVYCQLSRTEGLPNSLCEAMLCGCVPVGSDAGGIPTAIGETGFLVAGGEIDQAAAAIRSALHPEDTRGESARNRIVAEFPIERRERGLLSLIDEACS